MKQESHESIQSLENQSKAQLAGNILLFYAFDIGDDIDLQAVKNRRLLPTHVAPLSPFFKNYHIPQSFHLDDVYPNDAHKSARNDCISSKMHNFGVLSFCYKIPFQESFEGLKLKLINVEQTYDKKSDDDARAVFKVMNSAVRKSNFYNLKNSYFAIQVNPVKDKISPEEFKEQYANKIASLLRLETETLSEYQKDDILSSTTGYYGEDLIIIDSHGSFVYDDEYFEPMEFFESATIQQLELQYFDQLLDKKLNVFYAEQSYKLPWTAYVPLVGRKLELPVYTLARLRADISMVTERLENSIKLAGDAYYEKMYSMLVAKLSIPTWKDSISRKMGIIQDLYTVNQGTLDTVRGELLTVVIIVLIAVETLLAFYR